MLKDRAFFDKVIAILADRLIYEPEVWQYAFYHKHNEQLMREYIDIAQPSKLFDKIGAEFKSNLVDVDSKDSGSTWFNEHLEYHPLINGRAHSVGNGKNILNATFRATYDKFLNTMVQKASLSNEEKLILVYYLQLQDRMHEAIDLFSKV